MLFIGNLAESFDGFRRGFQVELGVPTRPAPTIHFSRRQRGGYGFSTPEAYRFSNLACDRLLRRRPLQFPVVPCGGVELIEFVAKAQIRAIVAHDTTSACAACLSFIRTSPANSRAFSRAFSRLLTVFGSSVASVPPKSKISL